MNMADMPIGVPNDRFVSITAGRVLEPHVGLGLRQTRTTGGAVQHPLTRARQKHVFEVICLEQLTHQDPRDIPVDLRAVRRFVGDRPCVVLHRESDVNITTLLIGAGGLESSAVLPAEGGDGDRATVSGGLLEAVKRGDERVGDVVGRPSLRWSDE